jgi:hypothetical protein
MVQNPYETPREAASQPPFNWRRLFWRGLWIAGGGFSAVMFLAGLFNPGFEDPAAIASMIVAVIAGIVFHVGLLMAIVGGIGWAVTMNNR